MGMVSLAKRFCAEARRYAAAAAAFCIYLLVTKCVFGYVCPSMIITGLPCPGCGLTRAGVYFFTGRFSQSLEVHPLFIPVFLLALCAAICKLFFPDKLKRFYIPAVILAFCLFAVYLVRMKYLFPHYPPMTPNKDFVLRKIIYFEKRAF